MNDEWNSTFSSKFEWMQEDGTSSIEIATITVNIFTLPLKNAHFVRDCIYSPRFINEKLRERETEIKPTTLLSHTCMRSSNERRRMHMFVFHGRRSNRVDSEWVNKDYVLLICTHAKHTRDDWQIHTMNLRKHIDGKTNSLCCWSNLFTILHAY